jgi:CTP synthase
MLEGYGLGDFIMKRFGLGSITPDLQSWNKLVERINSPKTSISIALVGKYVELHDAYLSVIEALGHAGIHYQTKVDVRWISSEKLNRENIVEQLNGVSGILVPGGFGDRGIEGKILAADYARTRNIPYFGLCLGMQCATIAFARHVLGDPDANSTEFNPHTSTPIIDFMIDQLTITEKGGTMRLGAYPCVLTEGSRTRIAYGENEVSERHRHRFEFNNKYRKQLEDAGMIISGQSPDKRLVEIIELRDHPWFVGTQFHPELLSRPNRPHPLFQSFVGAALKHEH